MNYGFTVTKHGDKTQISDISYTCIWTMFKQSGLQIVYKYKHTADKNDPHVHFHGLIFSPSGRINYKEFMKTGYSIKFEVPTNLDKWHNYCRHEERAEIKQIKEASRESYEKELYNKVMNSGPTYKQTKIKVKKSNDTLFKLILQI